MGCASAACRRRVAPRVIRRGAARLDGRLPYRPAAVPCRCAGRPPGWAREDLAWDGDGAGWAAAAFRGWAGRQGRRAHGFPAPPTDRLALVEWGVEFNNEFAARGMGWTCLVRSFGHALC